MGDLNLNKLKPYEKEGKIRTDFGNIQGFECIIRVHQPTRITTHFEYTSGCHVNQQTSNV